MPEDKKEVKPKLGSYNKQGEPAVGMEFENSRDKLLHFKSSRDNPAMKESLINQVKLHEGNDAANELRKEINFKYDEEKNIRPVDFIHNPNGKLTSPGWDDGSPRTYTWCEECDERCYMYSVIRGSNDVTISRCNKCGTDCIEIDKKTLDQKQEERGCHQE